MALYGSLGINLGLMITGGYYLGKMLENTYHFKNMTVTGVLVGLFLGFYEMFLVAYRAGSRK